MFDTMYEEKVSAANQVGIDLNLLLLISPILMMMNFQGFLLMERSHHQEERVFF